MKTDKQQSAAAAAFAERWKDRGYERGESQPFWIDLLSNVYGVETPSNGFITFEDHRMVDSSNFIDGRIPSTKVLIEQKSLGKDLRKGIVQSDGSLLNPFQQARRYVVGLPVSEHPRWIVTCNFSEFLVYDMEQPNAEPEQILLENLGKEYYRLQFLVDAKNDHLRKEMEVSMQAGEIVGRIYEALLKQYDDNSPEALRWLNILCVRIVFCLYAEDAGIFSHDQFYNYLVTYEAKDLRRALRDLFEVLNTQQDKRSKYLQEDLAAFPYTNGGLFAEEIEIPQFTEELKETLLQNASLDFDWSEISPTIFGAVFESTLNPETRRSGGMHYTSIENIHKVIDPLFLNDLRSELDEILDEKVEKQRVRKLDAYQDKLASLTFLDPACGSGNFLTETYLSLRRLENEAIRERYHGQTMMGAFVCPIKVSIQQFYGILTKGNQPSDGGHLILSEEDKEDFIKNDPTIECCIRRYVGAKDYLNNNEIRYCLWLRDVPFEVYSTNKNIYERLKLVKEMRASSTAAPTRLAADKPFLFFSMPQTNENYLVIPRVSSEKRRYIPIGFMTPDIIAADSLSIIPGATLYHFGILTSNVHMAWMRVVCGRLKSDYRYSGGVVYNNFPWPNPTDEQKAKIEQTAQSILDARALYPDSSLADLYDELTMPVELRKAHQDNDRAVMAAYGFPIKSMTESQCVAELFKLYQELTNKNQ